MHAIDCHCLSKIVKGEEHPHSNLIKNSLLHAYIFHMTKPDISENTKVFMTNPSYINLK